MFYTQCKFIIIILCKLIQRISRNSATYVTNSRTLWRLFEKQIYQLTVWPYCVSISWVEFSHISEFFRSPGAFLLSDSLKRRSFLFHITFGLSHSLILYVTICSYDDLSHSTYLFWLQRMTRIRQNHFSPCCSITRRSTLT